MKKRVSFLVLTFAATSLLGISAYAQEESPILESVETNRETNFNEDKNLNYDHPSHASAVKDSSSMAPRQIQAPSKIARPESTKEVRKEKNEEDALTFNFLYYMIQKFKLTDLIDQ